MAMPAPKDIYEPFEERFGVRFIEGYGLTETGMVTYHPPHLSPRPGSCGLATPGFEVSIVQPGTDLPVPPDTPGEIVVDMKMPNIVMRSYAGMPEKTAEDFRNLKLHTGDLGKMDEQGYVYFLDRVKDYIRRRGENVSSMEVEAVFISHDDVLEAAAVGRQGQRGRVGRGRDPGVPGRPRRARDRPRRAARLVRGAHALLRPAALPARDGVAAQDAHRAGAQGGAARRRHHGRHLRPRGRGAR